MENEEKQAVEIPANPPAEKSKSSNDARICAISFLVAVIVVLAYHGIVTMVKYVSGDCDKNTQVMVVRKGDMAPDHHRLPRKFRERGEKPGRGEREWRERRERGERRRKAENAEKNEKTEKAEKSEKAAETK